MNALVDPRGIPPSHQEILDALSLFDERNQAGTLTDDEARLGITLTRTLEIVFALRRDRQSAREERDRAREELATERMARVADQSRAMAHSSKAQTEAARALIVLADTRGVKNAALLELLRETLAAGHTLPKLLRKKIGKVLNEQA